QDTHLRRLAESSGEDGVEEGADRARGVDRAEADRLAQRRRPGEGPDRLHEGADGEGGEEELPVRARRGVDSARAGSGGDHGERADGGERDQTGKNEAPPHVSPIGARRPSTGPPKG